MKPENLLLVSKTDDTNIKVVDFGFAVQQTEGLVGQAGTPGYVAPEILEKKPQGNDFQLQCNFHFVSVHDGTSYIVTQI